MILVTRLSCRNVDLHKSNLRCSMGNSNRYGGEWGGQGERASKGLKSLTVTLDVSFLSLKSSLAHIAFLLAQYNFCLHRPSYIFTVCPIAFCYLTLHTFVIIQSSQALSVKSSPEISVVETHFRFTTRPGLCNSRLAPPTHVLSPPSSNSTGHNTFVFAS